MDQFSGIVAGFSSRLTVNAQPEQVTILVDNHVIAIFAL
jgi:hypothetical protein